GIAFRIDDANAWRGAINHHKNPIVAVDGDPGCLPEAGQSRLPLPRRAETVNTAVRAVGDVDAPALIERQIIRLPQIGQWRIRLLIGGRGRTPVSAQYESPQREYAQPVIAGVADEQIAGADADAVRIA